MCAQNQTQNTSKTDEPDASILSVVGTMPKIEWETVAMMTGERYGEHVVIRWRKHPPVGRLRRTHAVDVTTCGGRCTIFDSRAMTEAQAERWFTAKLRELAREGFTAAVPTCGESVVQ